MKKFLITYHAPTTSVNQFKNASPEQISEATKPWMEWKAANEKNVLDFGSRLIQGEEKNIQSEWKDSNTEITGFSILQADNKAALKEILNNHPQFQWAPECRVSIHEFQSM